MLVFFVQKLFWELPFMEDSARSSYITQGVKFSALKR